MKREKYCNRATEKRAQLHSIAVISCEWHVVPLSHHGNTSSGKRCCWKREGKLFWLKIAKAQILKNYVHR